MALGRGGASLCLLLILVPCVFTCVRGTQYTVGGSSGWTLSVDYATWASQYKFRVGDTLLFSYSAESHDVAEVTQANYDSCSTANPIQTYQTGNTVITLSNATSYYFMCTVPGHCTSGMKLGVTVLASSAPAPKSPTPSSAPVHAPAPVSHPPASPPVSPSPHKSPSSAPASSSSPTPAPSSSPSSSVPSSAPSSPSSTVSPTSPSPSAPPSSSPSVAAPPYYHLLPSSILLILVISAGLRLTDM